MAEPTEKRGNPFGKINPDKLKKRTSGLTITAWVHSKGLASKILGRIARQLPYDWQQRYGYRPVLLETFVQSPRYAGTCYKAANWQCIGRTVGRGKMSTTHEPTLPAKAIWIYPLNVRYKEVLCR